MPVPKLVAVDLNLLVAAEILLCERSLARAASRLGVTRSAASRTLTRLRELFEDPLLVRDGNSMSVTPRAQAILPALREALARCEDVLAGPTTFDARRVSRRFTMILSDYVAELLAQPLCEALAREAPHVDLEVFPARRDFARALGQDVDLTVCPATEQLPDIITNRGFSDRLACVLRRDHPDAAALTLERFVALSHLLVAPRNLRTSQVDVALSERGLSRRIAVTLPYFNATAAILARSDLVLTAPERLARRLCERQPLVLVAAPVDLPGFSFRVSWHARLQHDPAHAFLRALVGRVCRAVEAAP